MESYQLVIRNVRGESFERYSDLCKQASALYKARNIDLKTESWNKEPLTLLQQHCALNEGYYVALNSYASFPEKTDVKEREIALAESAGIFLGIYLQGNSGTEYLQGPVGSPYGMGSPFNYKPRIINRTMNQQRSAFEFYCWNTHYKNTVEFSRSDINTATDYLDQLNSKLAEELKQLQ